MRCRRSRCAVVVSYAASFGTQVREYARLAPLVVSATPLGRVANARDGDAVIAFSRRGLHGLRKAVERHCTDLRCCMVRALLLSGCLWSSVMAIMRQQRDGKGRFFSASVCVGCGGLPPALAAELVICDA